MKWAIVEGLTVTNTEYLHTDSDGAVVVATVTDVSDIPRYFSQRLAIVPFEEDDD